MQDQLKAAIYLRVSSKGQAEHGYSLESQLKSCRGMLAAKGWEEVGVYSDNGVSGTTMGRPGMESLLAECRAGNIGAVVTYELSRFGRTAVGVLNAIYALKDLGVQFISVKDSIDTSTDVGRLVLTVLSGIAQFESERKGTQIRAGQERAVAKGKRLGRRVHVPAAIKSRIAKLRKTKTLQQVADLLNAEGVPAPAGKSKDRGKGKWYPASVARHTPSPSGRRASSSGGVQ